jgi:hypothetical protein
LKRPAILKNYSVEYSLPFHRHSRSEHPVFFTDNPVAGEEFVQELLERGMGLHAIKHEGVDLPKVDFDRIVKIAAAEVAARLICTSLKIKPEEERYRFAFAA